jgi:hypothetical protein
MKFENLLLVEMSIFIGLKIYLKIKIYKKNNNNFFNIDVVSQEDKWILRLIRTCAVSILGNILGATLSISVEMIKKNVTYINNVVIYREMRVR